MALAGLQNVPALESSMFRESQSSSSSSRQRGNRGSISTRASSILQMWRELEDECAVNRARERGRPRLNREGNDSSVSPRAGVSRGGLVESSDSENGSVINPVSQMGNMNEQEDRQSLTSEQSLDLGEVERERVRNIFREWMNSGGNAETSRGSRMNRSLRGQCVGDNELVRNWVQSASHPRGACVWSRDDQVADNVPQTEQIRSGQVSNLNEGEPGTSRRQIRKLCGRQALLDLLAKREQERRQELEVLEGTRPVSSFAHRNRIQSLLRLRSFQNRGSTEMRRPTSPAESELGLLRQRQTVSGLREGFLSRLDSNANGQASDVSDRYSENNSDGFRDDRSQANCANEVLDGLLELSVPINPTEMPDVAVDRNDQRNNVDVAPSDSDSGILSSGNSDNLIDCNEGTSSQRLDIHVEGRLEHAMDNSVNSTDSSNDEIRCTNPEEPSRMGSGQFTDLEERHESTNEHYSDIDEPDFHNELHEQVDVSVNVHGLESDEPREDELAFAREWESAFSNQWRDDQIETDRLHLPSLGEDSSHRAVESEGEQIDMQEDYWHENGSQDTPRDWLGMASDSRLASDRVGTYFFSDDDNVYHIELRELVNRRRVSSLLHSDFRDSLDQLIQSYVERQANAPDDWELQEMLPPPYLSRNRAQPDTEQEEFGPLDVRANGNEPTRSPPPPPPLPQAHWRRGMQRINLARHDARQRPGTEWEIVNDLRIDMARLQQRLNNMQRMLEACMDMQLELQRSVRQEVSSALSRSANPSESPETILPKDSFKWDCVRKGVCCICSDTNIDSLLYRCGHMCTCTKCADVLVQGNGKCPMCQAPVVEVIRAYFIQ
ncbi:hypothetical protein vseg_015394 [Gypsophila vaccaria]